MTSEEKWDLYMSKMDSIDIKVEEAIKKDKQRVFYVNYSAYKTDKDDNPIDNLNRVAIKGKVILEGLAEKFYGCDRAKNFRSKVLENPTWLDIAVQANRMIKMTKDHHHVFLEGVRKTGKNIDGIRIYEFSMGS